MVPASSVPIAVSADAREVAIAEARELNPVGPTVVSTPVEVSIISISEFSLSCPKSSNASVALAPLVSGPATAASAMKAMAQIKNLACIFVII